MFVNVSDVFSDNAKVIDIGNFRSRLTLESWHTAKDRNADNNSKPLPQQYTVNKHNSGSNVAKHAWDNDHVTDLDNAKVIDIGNFRSRLTLEPWHTAKDRNADNNSKPLPRQYTVLRWLDSQNFRKI